MAHIGEEFRFGTVGGLGGQFCFLQGQFELFALCDIFLRTDHAQSLAVGIAADHPAAGKQPFPAAILEQHTVLDDVGVCLAIEMCLQVLHYAWKILRMNGRFPFTELTFARICGYAEYFLAARREKHFTGLDIPVPNAFTTTLQCKFPALFACLEFLLVLLAFGDVVYGGNDNCTIIHLHETQANLDRELTAILAHGG